MRMTTSETIASAMSLIGQHMALSLTLATKSAKKAINDAQEALKNAEH